MIQHTLKELEALPTLAQGQADDMKIDNRDTYTRTWLSRMTIEDGMEYNNQVTVEKLTGDGYVTIKEYEAK